MSFSLCCKVLNPREPFAKMCIYLALSNCLMESLLTWYPEAWQNVHVYMMLNMTTLTGGGPSSTFPPLLLKTVFI